MRDGREVSHQVGLSSAVPLYYHCNSLHLQCHPPHVWGSWCQISITWLITRIIANVLDALFLTVQCDNMAREGLRTLVVAKKVLTEEQYQDFEVSFIHIHPLKNTHPSEINTFSNVGYITHLGDET